jgi:hypothetical protein
MPLEKPGYTFKIKVEPVTSVAETIAEAAIGTI